MAFDLPTLPYARTDLQPHISENTLDFHYGKHHQAYVTNLNNMIEGTELSGKSLEDIIAAVDGDASKAGIYNNAAQVWNHTFYWHSMKPNGGGAPTGPIAEMIDRDFGSYDAFKDEFAQAGATQFGSGWAWLVVKDGKLEVRKTLNAITPVTEAGVTPLITMDVWEHAYYLDFQNARPKYIETWLSELVNWDFANENLASAR
ncbi:MAG: superoxide dismutase [Pseudomonadota bacterium]